jgi:hypothetical protein
MNRTNIYIYDASPKCMTTRTNIKVLDPTWPLKIGHLNYTSRRLELISQQVNSTLRKQSMRAHVPSCMVYFMLMINNALYLNNCPSLT